MRKWCLVCSIIVITLLIGCTSFKNVTSPLVDEFRQRMLAQYSEIDQVKVSSAPILVHFLYTMKKQYSASETKEIFLETREFVKTPGFDSEVIHGEYFKAYKGEQNYPRIVISFATKGNKESDYAYRSDYDEKITSGPEQDSTGYSTWYYNPNNGEMPVEVSD